MLMITSGTSGSPASAASSWATTYEWLIERYGLADSTERWREFYDARPGWVFTIANFRSFRASTSPSSKVMYGRPTPR
jgi:acyl-coenzyme A synthetase/AMP-(fatty) acid ligase